MICTGLERKAVQWNSMQTLVALGLVHTICGAQALAEDTIIETLRLNLHRLRKLQNDFQHLILMATGSVYKIGKYFHQSFAILLAIQDLATLHIM